MTKRWPASRVPDDGQIAARRALAYEEFARRLREKPGLTHVTLGDRLPTDSAEWVPVEMAQGDAPPARLHGNYEDGFAMAASYSSRGAPTA
jgi:hypothetical protein